MCVLSINPSTVDDNRHIFRVNFNDTICHQTNFLNETGEWNSVISYENCEKFYDDKTIRNSNHKLFNHYLKKMCDEEHIKFIDLWEHMTQRDEIKSTYRNIDLNDHHVLPSEEHFRALLIRFLSL